MTEPQFKLIGLLHDTHQGQAEYWPLINDWIGSRKLHLGHVNRTIASLIKQNLILIDDDGYVNLTEHGRLEFNAALRNLKPKKVAPRFKRVGDGLDELRDLFRF